MEHEITGHTRKIYKIIKQPGESLKHKLKEIGIEILIIVFAVSLAGYLEKQRELSREQQETKSFLIGLKTDLEVDLNGMNQDYATIKKRRDALKYLLSATQSADSLAIPTDSLNKHMDNIRGLQILFIRKGRYEGFKTSGKISTIENKTLQNDILTYYEDDIPVITATVDYNNSYQNKFFEVITEQIGLRARLDTKFKRLLAQTKVNNYLAILYGTTSETMERYNKAITLSQKILKEIDEEH